MWVAWVVDGQRKRPAVMIKATRSALKRVVVECIVRVGWVKHILMKTGIVSISCLKIQGLEYFVSLILRMDEEITWMVGLAL